MRPGPRPSGMRRVVVVVPSLFTLFNLFFGIWSLVLATRGEFYRASWFIVFAGVLDALDGRVARLSQAGTRFGAELDSLVDIVSFGVAPAFLIYQVEFSNLGPAAWIFCYFYVMAVAIRLARFNLTQAGQAKATFVGLPSPAAGMTLATYYPFTQTDVYRGALATLPWNLLLTFLIILLAILMVSRVRYANLPRAGLRSGRGLLGLATILCIVIFGVWQPDIFFFPLGITFTIYGAVRAALLGVLEGDEGERTVETQRAGPVALHEPDEPGQGLGHRRGGGG